MLANLLTVTGQVATLFLMMGVGFVLGRTGKLTEAGQGQMSYLLLYVVCPCVMVDSFLVEATPELKRELLLGGGILLVIYLLSLALALPFFRRQDADGRDILRFGGTDAGAIHQSRAGVYTGGISVATRYVHTPLEMADLDDIEACVALTAAFAQARLD